VKLWTDEEYDGWKQVLDKMREPKRPEEPEPEEMSREDYWISVAVIIGLAIMFIVAIGFPTGFLT
jgi:preprotein translocase subunit Sss1